MGTFSYSFNGNIPPFFFQSQNLESPILQKKNCMKIEKLQKKPYQMKSPRSPLQKLPKPKLPRLYKIMFGVHKNILFFMFLLQKNQTHLALTKTNTLGNMNEYSAEVILIQSPKRKIKLNNSWSKCLSFNSGQLYNENYPIIGVFDISVLQTQEKWENWQPK